MTPFILNCRSGLEDLEPLFTIQKVGKQSSGTYVLNKDIEISATGEVVNMKKYLWNDDALQCGNGDHLQMASSLVLPLDEAAARRYYMRIRKVVPSGTFYSMILIAGKSVRKN